MEQGLLGVALIDQGSAWAGESGEGRRLGEETRKEEERMRRRDLAGHWGSFSRDDTSVLMLFPYCP